MDLYFYIAIGFLSGAFIWHELKIRSRFRIWNIISKVLIIGSVIFLYHTTKDAENTSTTFILTPGFSQQQLDSLLKTYPNAVVHSSSSSLPAKDNERIFILGEGLPESELRLISAETISFLPPSQHGIASVEITKQAYVDEIINLSGLYKDQEMDDGTILKIHSPWSNKSIEINGPWKHEFIGEQPGNFLIELDNGKARIPFKVDPLPRLKILLQTDQPDFQTNFLKNYLQSAGHEVVFNTSVSKDISFAQSPSSATISQSLTPENLEKVDILITDVSTISKGGSSKRRIISNAVMQGLGLLILPGEEGISAVLSQWLETTMKVSEVRKRNNVSFMDITADHPLLVFNNDSLRSFYAFKGKGKIGGMGVLNDYYWKLSGNDSLYRKSWKELIYKISGSERKEFQANIDDPLAFKHAPVSFSIVSSDPSPLIFIDQVPIPLKQDIYWSERWSGTYWPRDSGWHAVHNETDTLQYFYVNNDRAKPLAPRRDIMSETAKFAGAGIKPAMSSGSYDIYRWLVIFVLLISLGYLWIEPKL